MQPRDRTTAARVLSVLYLVGGSVTTLGSLLEWADGAMPKEQACVAALAGIGVMVLGALARLPHSGHEQAWAIAPFGAIGLIVFLDLLTRDASVSAQVFLFFPALYGASQLRKPGAIAVTSATIAAELAVVLPQVGLGDAIVSAGYVTAVIVTAAVLLIQSGHAQEVLIRKLERQAAVDSLTGLVTRRVFDDAAQSALSGGASGEGTALILLDIDNFKWINDRHGHPGGDEVLVQMSTLLVAGTRRTDIVSRLGGDEIAMLLPGCSEAEACRRAEQILGQVRAHSFTAPDGSAIEVSVSLGVAHAPTHAKDLRSLYASTDAALYSSKRAGRDQLQVAQNQSGAVRGRN